MSRLSQRLAHLGLNNRYFRKPLFLRYCTLSLSLIRMSDGVTSRPELMRELELGCKRLIVRSRTLLLPPWDVISDLRLPLGPSEGEISQALRYPKVSVGLMLSVAWSLWVCPFSLISSVSFTHDNTLGESTAHLASELLRWGEEIARWLRHRREASLPYPLKEWLVSHVPRGIDEWCERFEEMVETLSSEEVELLRLLSRLRSNLKRQPVRRCVGCGRPVLKSVAMRLTSQEEKGVYLCERCAFEALRGRRRLLRRLRGKLRGRPEREIRELIRVRFRDRLSIALRRASEGNP